MIDLRIIILIRTIFNPKILNIKNHAKGPAFHYINIISIRRRYFYMWKHELLYVDTFYLYDNYYLCF